MGSLFPDTARKCGAEDNIAHTGNPPIIVKCDRRANHPGLHIGTAQTPTHFYGDWGWGDVHAT